MKSIRTTDEYKQYLQTTFTNADECGDTSEGLGLLLVIHDGLTDLGFSNNAYCSAVWNTMHSFSPEGFPPSAAELDVMNFYKKQSKGWYDYEVCRDYGKAFFNQMPEVLAKLQRDPFTRQAVIRMPGDTCLLSVQFIYRTTGDGSKVLMTFANFRSSDAVWGLPADVYVLQRLTDYLLGKVAFQAEHRGLVISASSFHVYDKDLPALLLS